MPSKIILERDAAAAAAAADILSRYQGESRSRGAVCISYTHFKTVWEGSYTV